MAILTTEERADLRQRIAKLLSPMPFTKTQLNAALQAIEDAWQSTSNVGGKNVKAYFAEAVETAVPGVFTNAQKAKLFAIWCVLNAKREGVL